MMQQWLNFLNGHSTSWLLDLAWPMVWQSSLLIVVAAVASRTVLRKSSAQLRYGLWCVVLLRLMLPPTLDLPTSIGHWGTPVMQRHAPAFAQTERLQPAVSEFMRQPLVSNAKTQPAPMRVIDSANSRLSITFGTAVSLLWALATTLLTVLLVVRISRLHRVIRAATPAPDALSQLVDRARAQMRLRRPVAALITESDLSPAVYGLFRPRILLPRTVVDELDGEQLYAVIVHELAHIKRGDYWVNWIQLALGIVYFFHPLAWYANRRMRIEREQACDDMTLIALGLNRDGYAESLVRVAERVSVAGQFAPAQVGVVETKLHLARRIRRILNRRLRPVARLTGLSTATVLAFAAIFGSWHYTQAESGAVEMLSLRVKVVDESAEPVADASVLPVALGAKTQKGSMYGWREKAHGKANAAKTDAQGLAQIQYPRQIIEHLETGTVVTSVSRSGYVAQKIELNVGGSTPPITLERAATVRVSGYVGAKENTAWPIYALMEFPKDLIGEDGWKSVEGGSEVLENSAVSDGKHYLWLAHRSPQGLLFSRSQEVVAQKGKTVELSVALEPGCRLEGELDVSVPRPVKNGIAEVRVIPNEILALKLRFETGLQWTAQAPIQEDGSFVFESLPIGHAEIAAFCDGAVVKYSDAGTSPQHGQPFPTTTSGGLVTGIVVPMQATATAVIMMEDPDGRPLADAKINVSPNLIWFKSYGNFALPSPLTTEQSLQMDLSTQRKAYHEALKNKFYVTTDKAGKAVVEHLPAFVSGFLVRHESFQLPAAQCSDGMPDMARIDLKPGEITEVHVRMEPKGISVLGEGTAAKDVAAPKSIAPTCPPQAEDKFALPTTPATPKNQLEGQVVDEAGKPLAGVNVNAWTWCPGSETNTDSEGRFTLADFDPDQTTIEVRFSKDAYSPVYMFRQPLGKMSQAVAMNDKTYFEGTVTDRSGKPVADALVRADSGRREAEGVLITETATETHTKADGTYRHYVQNDTYTVTALSSEQMQTLNGVVVAKNEAKRLDIQLEPAPVFRAKVVDSVTQQPVAGVQFGNWQWKGIKGISDANGMVSIAGIPGDTFEFDVDGKEADVVRWWSDQATREFERFRVGENKWQRNFDSLAFKITPDMEPVTVVVERGARIRGTVIDPDGKPVAKATVAPALTGTGNSLTGDTRFSVETDDAGNFDMLLPASKIREYNLIAHDGDYDEWRNWANAVMEPITTQPGDVLEGVKLQLRRPCEVRGQAVDEQGKPVADREVRASTVELDDNRYYNPTTRTDSEGRFILKYVAPGKHYVQVAPFWLKPTEAPEGTSQIVEVTPEKPAEGIALKAKPRE